MTGEQIFAELREVLPKLEKLSREIGEGLYASNDMDEDQRFLVNQLRHLDYKHLQDVVSQLRYLDRSVRVEGILTLQPNGRYSIDDWELSSGSPVELLIYDKDEERHDWQATRIEHSHAHGGYYAYHYPELQLNGIRARIRK
ncbi:TPA: hypothetical protein HLT81_24145 [Escherichia coli]|nr:hypothetical protein [Escherichia coli]